MEVVVRREEEAYLKLGDVVRKLKVEHVVSIMSVSQLIIK
jgi:hypothetical protein